jgi:hypothetical protein
VAAAMTAAVEGLQAEKSAGEKTLEEFAAYMQSAPLDELKQKDAPKNLDALNPQQIENFVEQNTVPVDPPPQLTPSTAAAQTALDIKDAVEELQQFKAALGGSAAKYNGQRPAHGASTRMFMGRPGESCQIWVRGTIQDKWFPEFFWNAMGKYFEVDVNISQYDKASLYLDSMRLLAENRDMLEQAFIDDLSKGGITFSKVTRLAGHPDLQPIIVGEENSQAKGMMRIIDSYLELFSALYKDAKEKETLEQFFSEALNGVCMEARIGFLQAYAATNPVGANEAIPFDPGHSENDTVFAALQKEVAALSLTIKDNYDDVFIWDNIFAHLANTMVGEERQGEEGRVTITAEMIENARAELNDIYYFD